MNEDYLERQQRIQRGVAEMNGEDLVGVSRDALASKEAAFFRSVYAWMFGGLLITAVAAYWISTSVLQATVQRFMWPLLIAELVLVFALAGMIRRLSPMAAAAMFLGYAFLNGLTLSIIFKVYSLGSIGMAFMVAGGMFAAMSLYGMVTKRNLTSWGSFFFMGLIGIILASVANFWFKSPGLSFTVSIIGVFVFVGLTAYDTQKLKSYAAVATSGNVTQLAVIGALALYLDFVNLFLMLLRLFGGSRR